MLDTYAPSVLMESPNPLSYDQRLLWCAVLEQAVEDFRGCCDQNNDKNSPSHRRMRQEQAAAWFKSDRSEINSFFWICDLLGLDAVAIREKLLAEKKTTYSLRHRSTMLRTVTRRSSACP